MAKSRVGGSGSRLDGRYSITTPKDGRDRGEPTERCPQYEAQRERERIDGGRVGLRITV
jgi:hypothetical protein